MRVASFWFSLMALAGLAPAASPVELASAHWLGTGPEELATYDRHHRYVSDAIHAEETSIHSRRPSLNSYRTITVVVLTALAPSASVTVSTIGYVPARA
jgi:hypothetical protein